jgi:hypothetical protein
MCAGQADLVGSDGAAGLAFGKHPVGLDYRGLRAHLSTLT